MGNFENKVVIVTGASSGIGAQTAMCFAEQGAKVVLAARREEEGREIAAKIKANGAEAMFVKTDIAVAKDVENLVNTTIQIYGKLDCAINNAGTITPPIPLIEGTEEEFDRVININLKGTWLCLKHQIPHMLENGGSIVNIASMWGVGASNFPVSAYTASKHGVVGLTKAAALEYAPNGVRVNAICTAWVEKEGSMTQTDPEFRKKVISAHPLGYLGTTEEVGHAALYLCSDQAKFITGHSLMMDSGISVNTPIIG